mmetsp:Transcript_23828/g.18187  ORF Transcript_23828/g.18187 Transcript_23828/m.18187 type:complete len:93 (-) Transcript_23828:2-280(-)
MLVFDPSKRITIEEALKHPYLASLHQPEDEPTTDEVSGFDFDFEIYQLDNEHFRRLIYDEIQLYHNNDLIKKYIEDKKRYPEGALHLYFDLK